MVVVIAVTVMTAVIVTVVVGQYGSSRTVGRRRSVGIAVGRNSSSSSSSTVGWRFDIKTLYLALHRSTSYAALS